MTNTMREFMVCSLVNDDTSKEWPALAKSVEQVAAEMSLPNYGTLSQLWIGFLVRAYSDSLTGPSK